MTGLLQNVSLQMSWKSHQAADFTNCLKSYWQI